MTYTVNCSILWPDLPLLERPAAAKAAGFDAVEFWWPFESSVPEDSDAAKYPLLKAAHVLDIIAKVRATGAENPARET
ncbi:hydroxypyruvate isomerase [Arthrobacter sp. GAS37]